MILPEKAMAAMSPMTNQDVSLPKICLLTMPLPTKLAQQWLVLQRVPQLLPVLPFPVLLLRLLVLLQLLPLPQLLLRLLHLLLQQQRFLLQYPLPLLLRLLPGL